MNSIQTTSEKVSITEKRLELFEDDYEEEKKESDQPRSHLLDTITIQREDNEILAKERELMFKAKQLETEMLAIRKAKVDSVLR